MSRLIDADALMKELEREVELADDWKTAHEIANVVKYFPTIVPQRMCGRWIGCGNSGHWKCSVCGTRAAFWFSEESSSEVDLDMSEWLSYFCPHCGADMRGEQDDGKKFSKTGRCDQQRTDTDYH